MAQFVNMHKVELSNSVAPVVSLRQIFYGDVDANRIGAIVQMNGAPVTLGGTCSGTAILADGSTVALTGTVSGNEAYVVLPAGCYSMEGQIQVFVKLTVSGVTTTLLAAVGTVRLTETDQIIDPGAIIPSVAQLISDIEDAVASIPADYSGLLGSIAHTFSSSESYTAGKYVWYNGELYRFNVDHPAGAWIGTDAARYTATDEFSLIQQALDIKADAVDVADLKSAIDEILDIETIPSKNLNKTPYPGTATVSGVTFTRNSDGSISMAGSPTGNIYWPAPVADSKWLLPAGTYTLAPGISSKIYNEILLYANKGNSSSTAHYTATNTKATFTTNIDYWAWVRFVVASDAVSDGVTLYPQVEAGSQATEYQDTNYLSYSSHVIADITDDIDALGDAISGYDADIASLNTRVDAVTEFEVGKNLVNPNTMETGGLQSSGSISTSGSWATYKTSAFIAIDENTNYVFSVFNTSTVNPVSTARVLALQYDENKAVISGTYQNVDSVGTIAISTVNTAKYVRVCSTGTYKFQLESGQNYTDYEAYSGKNVSALPLGSTPMAQTQAGNVLYGKKWAVCGDSFTYGADTGVITDGKYQGRRIVYPYIIGNRNNMDIVKFFNGGRTLAFPASPGTFVNSLTNPNYADYYQNIPEDADYITIYLGINDANHATGSSGDGEDTTGYIPLGTIEDNTTASYYGAWNVVLTWLITNRPNAHIGIIVTNGNASNDNYRLAQIAIAGKYGIPYIDLNGDARTPAMLRTSNPNIAAEVKTALIEKWRVSSSNTHPNDAAHLFESTFIENFLRSI